MHFVCSYLAANFYLMQIIKSIQHRIYTVRGHRVMLDRDLAELYTTETRALNQAVKRNISRFPEDFMFQLTINEWEQLQPELMIRENINPLRSQIVISSGKRGQRYLPHVFTEQGVAMLSSVLNSRIAIQVNIQIMRIFSKMKETLLAHKDILPGIEKIGKRCKTK